MSRRRFVKRKRPRSCGKTRYLTEIEAQMALLRVQAYDNQQGRDVPCRHYQCPHCGGHHLTSKPLPLREKGRSA